MIGVVLITAAVLAQVPPIPPSPMSTMTISDPIDRHGPTLRPPGRAVMRQTWADLLFLHWPVPVEVLRPLVPPGLEIDTYQGRAYIGLVPFAMRGVRPWWSPSVWRLSKFLEVNVRTYVHFRGRDPGVWFFSLDAANSIAVRLARRFFHLPYHFARMDLIKALDGSIDYLSDRRWSCPVPAGCNLSYRVEGTPRAAELGSVEHFLAERYILYAQGPKSLMSGRVHHSPYPLQPARLEFLQENLLAASGFARPEVDPLVHYASEVRTRIYPLGPVESA